MKEIKCEFKKQSRLGKGRAFLIFRDTPIIDFTREITGLCLKNYAYDPQCEGDRSEYAMQFLRELPNKQRQKVIEAVRTHLATDEISDSWDFDHFCTVAAKISLEFDATIGELLRKRYTESDDDTISRKFPERSLLRLDGFDGLVAVARRKGAAFRIHKDWSEDDSLFYDVPKMEDDEAHRRLESVAETDADVRSYLERISKTEESAEQYRSEREKNEPESNFEKVKQLIAKSKRVPPSCAQKLTPDELSYFARELRKTKTQAKRMNYFKLFSSYNKTKYPDDFHDLLAMLSPRKNCLYNERLIDSLSFFSAPELRVLAEKALDSDSYGIFYLSLLKKNYHEDDSARIAKRIRKVNDYEDSHYDLQDILKIYDENINADCLEPLRLIYENTPCGLCRQYATEIMEKAGILPDDIKEELPFDSYSLDLERYEEEKA